MKKQKYSVWRFGHDCLTEIVCFSFKIKLKVGLIKCEVFRTSICMTSKNTLFPLAFFKRRLMIIVSNTIPKNACHGRFLDITASIL